MIPQEAVDLVVTTQDVYTVNHANEWIEIFGPFFTIQITNQGVGVAFKWPVGETIASVSTVQCELSTLECSRIMNEVNRRLIS